jgi:hypothetical protein
VLLSPIDCVTAGVELVIPLIEAIVPVIVVLPVIVAVPVAVKFTPDKLPVAEILLPEMLPATVNALVESLNVKFELLLNAPVALK